MVCGVRAREAEFAPPLPPPPKRKVSRRLVLVLALAIGGNAVFAAIPDVYGAFGDVRAIPISPGWALITTGGPVVVYFAPPKEWPGRSLMLVLV
jgi:hypothetical protein